ncbi:MAG: SusC/RagA family TonB-linked outer membrane protein, partial [Mariniphaga sp.]
VGSISKKDIGDRTASSVGALIQGKVAGVDVSRDKIRIRGVTSLNNTDPLVIIDGFQGVSMSSINTNDVESIEVLKDASSTAIYGARGANGVILITTKDGKTGPLKVNINAFTGFGTTPKKYDMLNASQYIDYVKDALTSAKMTITDRLNSPEVRKDVTNWQNEIFQVSKASEINVDLSGGSENSSFFVSYGYRKNNEVYIGPSQDNSTIRIKNLFKIKKWFKAGDDVSLSYNLSRGATNSATSAGNIPFMTALPYMGVLDPTNYWGYTRANRYTDLSDSENPVGIINLTHPTGTTLNYSANLWFEIAPFKGLTYRVQAGVSGLYNRSTLWNNKYDDSANTTHPSNYSESYAYNFSPIVESYLTYTKQFGKHDFSAMIGNTWQNYATSGGIGIYGETFANETVKNVFQAQTKMIKNQDNAQFAYLSYFGRFNYQYNNRYLLTVNARRDGSPRFAPSNRWATFPSVALAWKMHEESFIKDLNVFDLLKLRASWGISGNDAIGDFKYLSQVWTNGVYYPLGNVEAPVQGATVSAPSSQSIKWESTESKSVGVDMAFLKNALSITTEYFVKNTNDILFAVPRAVSLGYGLGNPASAIVNAASVVNKGFELQVGYKNNIGSLKYSVNTNYTHVTNSVASLGLGQPYLSGISRTAKGEPIGYLFGHVAEGVFMNQTQLDAANQGAKTAAKAKNPAITDLALSKIYYQYSSTAPGDVK